MPGRKPSMHRAMLMRESALQRPFLTHTGSGGKMRAITTRRQSVLHILIEVARNWTVREMWRILTQLGGWKRVKECAVR
ncbi:hypothetical protein FH972_026089 [Carpinus fangiana]|uniref:Uncharacterized protein n=1 Tax=Carpinus fangiana TaxID=176857 RepID=A0A5N6L350_9ROSI|nr:hypothetical protein FH972_026089 [Carpinus fangiana]